MYDFLTKSEVTLQHHIYSHYIMPVLLNKVEKHFWWIAYQYQKKIERTGVTYLKLKISVKQEKCLTFTNIAWILC